MLLYIVCVVYHIHTVQTWNLIFESTDGQKQSVKVKCINAYNYSK